jgi:hypothetical protein
LRAPGMGGGGDGQQGRRQGGGEEQGVQGFHAHILAGREEEGAGMTTHGETVTSSVACLVEFETGTVITL